MSTRARRPRPGPPPEGVRLAGPVAVLLVAAATVPCLTPRRAQAAPAVPVVWTAADPDRLVEQSVRAAERAQGEGLARLLLAAALSDSAQAGEARRLLGAFRSPSEALQDQAQWLARWLEAPPFAEPPSAVRDARRGPVLQTSGLLDRYAVLGPFEDPGGGLDRREGPEAAGHDYRAADYSWGAYTVRYVQSLPASVTARGLDLDVYVYPRKESCTYLQAAVTVHGEPGDPGPWQLMVASSGAFRLKWDGSDVARSDELHRAAMVDRAAVQLPAAPGPHLLTLKVCSGALQDEGKVRLRLTDRHYRPLTVSCGSDPAVLQALADRLASPGHAGSPAAPAPAESPSAGRMPTCLEQALTLEADATPSRVLAAAVVRTLAGADDLRSLRAPGLLDRAVASPVVRPDELALAGFVSSAGANRSGWLTQAWERAAAAGDLATASFAQRALAEWRLEARMPDWADATVRLAPLGDSTDAHARVLGALVLAKQGGAGAQLAALGQLQAIARAAGPTTPLAVWQAIATVAEAGPANARLFALEQLAARRPDSRGPRYVRALRQLGAEGLERGARRVLAEQQSADAIVAVGQTLLDAGRYQAAREAFELAAELSPNRALAHLGLARAALALSSAPDATDRARAALWRARQLEPQDAQLGAEIAFRLAAGDGHRAGPAAADDERFLVEPAEFLARARANPARVGEQFERQLHFRRVVRLHADRRVSQLIHYAREIVVEPRTEDERYENLPALSHHTELVLARVHQPDGTVLAPEEQDTPSRGLPTVRWPKLQQGDVVEVAIRAWTPGPIVRRGEMPFYFVDYVGSAETRPVLYNEVVIDTPDGGLLSFDVINGQADRTEVERRDGRTITRLIWDAPPSIADEPFAPPASELLPVVVGSGFGHWDDFVDWYRGAVEGFTEPDEQVRRLAAELTRGAGGRQLDREQSIAALFEFVADDIRYVNYVSGEWWLPNRPQQLLARRQGDCDDKAMLLISLLKAVGIDAVEALIQTRMTSQPAILRSERVAIPMFDHGIIYLPGDGQRPGRFLDATNPESRLGPVPSMDSGAMALLVPPQTGATVLLPAAATDAAGRARVMPTPPAPAADHGTDAEWTLTVAESGAGELQAVERHVGDAALLLRTNLRQPDARAQWVEQHLLAGWLSSVEMDPEVSFDADLPRGAARLEYRARSRFLARREGAEMVVAIAPPMPLTAQLAPLATRTLPVLLPPSVAPRHYRVRVLFEAPRSYRFAELPPDSSEDGGPFGVARQSFVRVAARGAHGGEQVEMVRQLAFEQVRVEVADYGRWRAWLQGIDRMLQHGVRLVRR